MLKRYRWSIALALGVVPGVVAALALTSVGRDRSITAEPISVAPLLVVAPLEVPVDPAGVATPSFITERDRRTAHEPPRKIKLELLDPWTGEDLAPELALLERPHLEVDRRDPWDPAVLYPEAPGLDPRMDLGDPWVRTASADVAPAPIGSRHAPILDTSNPWEATAERVVPTSDDTNTPL